MIERIACRSFHPVVSAEAKASSGRSQTLKRKFLEVLLPDLREEDKFIHDQFEQNRDALQNTHSLLSTTPLTCAIESDRVFFWLKETFGKHAVPYSIIFPAERANQLMAPRKSPPEMTKPCPSWKRTHN